MNQFSKKTGSTVASLSALGLCLMGLSSAPAHASLVGDDITLDLQFASESDNPLTVGTQINKAIGGGPAPQSTPVVEGSVEFPSAEGIASTGGEFGDRDFTGEEPFSAIFTAFNVEADLIEGQSEVFWGLLNSDVAPFTWTYTFSDLDWADFSTNGLTGATLEWVGGSASGSFFAPGTGNGENVEPITGSFDVDFSSLLSLDVSTDSVRVAINIDPVLGSDLAFGAGSGAFGSAMGSFRIRLAGGNNSTDIPEPAALVGLLMAGGYGLKALKRGKPAV